MKTAFITGCATGFGRRITEKLLARGDRVIATDPEPDRLSDLTGEVLVLPLDVRDPLAIAEAVRRARAWSPPDVLVNNGGYAVFGSQEETDIDRVRDLFEVNVFGLARVTQALLPTLRARSGTVVQLSSVAGRTVFPESGWYAATKHAVEAMSEALFQECCTFGVKLRVIEPGSFDTRFLPTALAASPPRDPASPYASLRPLWDARKSEALEPPQDADRVAEAIVGSLDDPRPFLRLPVGDDAVRILELYGALGADAWSLLQGVRNGLPPPPGLRPESAFTADDAELARLRAICAAGQLEHWAVTEVGQKALARLRAP